MSQRRPLTVLKAPGVIVAGAILAASILIVAVTDMRPAYDAYGFLVWGRQTLHLDLDLNGAPSWKPLAYLFTLPYALAGRGQMWLWMVTAVAAALSSAVLAGRIAYRLTGPSQHARYAPVVAALFAGIGVLGISTYWRFILIANSDPMIVALCLGAIDSLLSRRHKLAFCLLVLAALGRPEVWPFVALYAGWAWRAAPSMRAMLAVGVLAIPILWFGVPAIAAKSALVAGSLADNAADGVHGEKISGVLGRLLGLYEWPMQLAVAASVMLAIARRDRTILLLAGAALLWIVIEIAFAFHGWPATARYLLEPTAVLIVITGASVGRVLAEARLSLGALRWAAPAVVIALVVALLPAARSRARYVHGEVSYSHKFARQVDRLRGVIARDGGAAHIRGCGQPVSALSFQTALAWEIGLNVGKVGWVPARSIRSGHAIVLFAPRGWGWRVRAINLRAADRDRCAGLAATTAIG